MSWILQRDYDEYVEKLDPYLKSLGAAERHHESGPEVREGCVFVGLVRFPSGLELESCMGMNGPLLCLWGDMLIPFYGFNKACMAAFRIAENQGYNLVINKADQAMEIDGLRPNRRHMVYFEKDRIVDVTKEVRQR